MRDHSWHKQLTREEALAKLIEVSSFNPGTEVVGMHDALGRVTAVECRSKYDLPNALCACMDGIAVHFADFEDGEPDTSKWEHGKQWDWANTGTAMPEGFDTEIAIENVEISEDLSEITINAMPSEKGAFTKAVGSDFKKDELLVEAHQKLTPAKIAALVGCGYTEVEVVAKPKVVFIPTGDELVMPGQELPKGKAYETNGIMLEHKLNIWGAEPVVYECIPDDWDAIKAALLKAAEEADIISINAGSSKGAKDFTMEILEEIGTVFCHETNHGPGRHTAAAELNGKPVLGLSGPPGGCEITADWYLKPLVESFLYGREIGFEKVTGTLVESLAGTPGPGGDVKPQGYGAAHGGYGAPQPQGYGAPAECCPPQLASWGWDQWAYGYSWIPWMGYGYGYGMPQWDAWQPSFPLQPQGYGAPYGGGYGAPQGGPGGYGAAHGGYGAPKEEKPQAGPSQDFFAIKPVHVKHTPRGVEITPLHAQGHANLLELDTANAYLCESPRKFGDMGPGTQVTVEMRYPYTAE